MSYALMTQSSSAGVSAISMMATFDVLADSRYPKRKRSRVNYCEIDAGEAVQDYESEVDEDDRPPPLKIVKTNQPRKVLPKRKVLPFLNLPPEIRNKIYQECLISDEFDSQGHPSLYFAASRRRYRHFVTRCTNECEAVKSLTINLLATCKRIHSEAAPMLYNHRFVFQDSLALMNFMSECMPQAAGLIRHIEVRDWLHGRCHKNIGFLAMSILAAKGCVNLESLKVTAGLFHRFDRSDWASDQAMLPIQERVAKKVYREFYPWLEAVGRASGKMYKGLDVVDIGDTIWNVTSAYRKPRRSPEQDENAITALKAAYVKALRRLVRIHWK